MNYRSLLQPAIWLLTLVALALPCTAVSDDSFLVEDIELVGLQRIQDGTVFNYLPISLGDRVDSQRIAQAIRALFATGFFDDVEMRRDGGVLVIVMQERPTIARFSISGNKDIKDEDLRRVLRGIGLAEGRIFNQSVLDNVELELRRQYFSRGKYGVHVDSDVREISNNMVAITIVIREGLVARNREINFIGNESFDDARLRREFELNTRNWLSWLRNDDQYSREKLQGDLESLRSFYMDQGYANFSVQSTQVAISPDRKDVYITINLEEGNLYTFGEIALSGDLIVGEEELRRFLYLTPGNTFSRVALTNSVELINLRLGQEGFAYSEVTPLPEIDHERRVVDLTLHVNPGSRVYVRRVFFTGSDRTDDETYRREMRQLEGTWLQSGMIDRSKFRLQRLPFVETVEIETVPVPGTDDLVDVEIDIKERNPGDFNFGVGFSGAAGILLNAGLTHSNFLGRGLRTSIELARSEFNENYSVGYIDPYWTTNGISRNINVFYRSMDSLFLRASPFVMNAYGLSMGFGVPVSEFNRFNIGLSLRDTEIIATLLSASELRSWVQNPNHGKTFTQEDPFFPGEDFAWGTRFRTLELTGGFVTDTRNRAIFADRGSMREYSFEVTIPPSEISYIVAAFSNESYFRLTDNLTLSFKGGIRAGTSYGDTSLIPPYKHFFGGGPDTIRGFRENWLGPRDSFDRPYGGNILLYGQMELIIPPPLERMRDKSRLSIFLDAGNVYQGRDNIELSQLRASAGIAVTWIAPIGAMKFSFAVPFRRQAGDETERFQFSIGSAF